MKRILILLILLTAGCIFQQPPQFGECSPSDTVLSVGSDEPIEFSCTVTDPDTSYLTYTWYINGSKVSDTSEYRFSMGTGDYTLLLEVSDGKTTISRQWDVTVTGSPNFEKIQDRVERIRGLKFLEPVKRTEIDRTQLRENLFKSLEEDRDAVVSEQKLYVALHVLGPQADLYQLYADLLTVQVASYYDTTDHTFYEVIDPDSPIIYREFIAAHEFIHALQDQYHYLDNEFANDDEELAYLCLVEGDATFHQYTYLEMMTYPERKSLFDYVNTLDIPVVNPFLESMIELRYDLGLQFVTVLSYSGIDSVYLKAPVSTEQVMHPEKYASNEQPVSVTIPFVSGWEKVTENVLGEAVIKTFLKEHIDLEEASRAAEGWGGDAYGYYERGNEHLLILNTFWDTKEDAQEFCEAYYNFTVSWSEKNVKKISENIYETPTGFLATIQREKQVIIVESSSLDVLTSTLSLMGFRVWIIC